MLCSFNVNRSHAANLALHLQSFGSCVLMSIVMALGKAEYGMLIMVSVFK